MTEISIAPGRTTRPSAVRKAIARNEENPRMLNAHGREHARARATVANAHATASLASAQTISNLPLRSQDESMNNVTGSPMGKTIGQNVGMSGAARSASNRQLLGVPAKQTVRITRPEDASPRQSLPVIESVSATVQNISSAAQEVKQLQGDLGKTVRKMPALYVIAFFAVVVFCAVAIIWNTLQVNKLTLERTRNDDKIAQSEQRLIKLRAQEMQLSAPSRIRDIAHTKLGMIEETGEETILLK